jgi:hypothetical protein
MTNPSLRGGLSKMKILDVLPNPRFERAGRDSASIDAEKKGGSN